LMINEREAMPARARWLMGRVGSDAKRYSLNESFAAATVAAISRRRICIGSGARLLSMSATVGLDTRSSLAQPSFALLLRDGG
jgi:hypothetical protein